MLFAPPHPTFRLNIPERLYRSAGKAYDRVRCVTLLWAIGIFSILIAASYVESTSAVVAVVTKCRFVVSANVNVNDSEWFSGKTKSRLSS